MSPLALPPAACAAASLAACLGALFRRRLRTVEVGVALVCASFALWAGLAAYTAIEDVTAPYGAAPDIVLAADLLRWAVSYGVVLALYWQVVPNGSKLPAWFAALGAVVVGMAALSLQASAETAATVQALAGLGRSLPILLLLENLFRSAPPERRWNLNLLSVALMAAFGYDALVYSEGLLFHRLAPALMQGRFIVNVAAVALLLVAARRGKRWDRRVALSRTLVFHSATLVIGGIFLVALGAVGEIMRRTGAYLGDVAAVALPAAGVVVLGAAATSGTVRSQVKRLVVENLFARRFDYRREWLRCIATLSDPTERLEMRVVRAIADTVDSPAGLVLLRDKEGDAFRWAASWNRPALTDTLLPGDPRLQAVQNGVVELDDGPDWLAVPLLQGGELLGLVLLSPPRAPFAMDEEVRELLGVIGRDAAGALASARARDALEQARELHEFGKRFAFLAHDIGTVSSQLIMLLDNARRHGESEEFQASVLETIGHCSQRLRTTLQRLRGADVTAAEEDTPRVDDPVEKLRRLAAVVAAPGRRVVEFGGDGASPTLAMDPHDLETVATHLLRNAIDASAPEQPVFVTTRLRGPHLQVDVADWGHGMTPEQVRDGLFRPFASTKQAGLGIGGYQVRDLVRKAGGNLVVISHPGAGTTMRVLLPIEATLARASGLQVS